LRRLSTCPSGLLRRRRIGWRRRIRLRDGLLRRRSRRIAGRLVRYGWSATAWLLHRSIPRLWRCIARLWWRWWSRGCIARLWWRWWSRGCIARLRWRWWSRRCIARLRWRWWSRGCIAHLRWWSWRCITRLRRWRGRRFFARLYRWRRGWRVRIGRLRGSDGLTAHDTKTHLILVHMATVLTLHRFFSFRERY